ncbi:hypothetical protein HC928_08330 [bacterium]|nr:hypothetical protein [bacterium]
MLGENSGNVETLAVQEVSLRSRTYTTLAAGVSPGDTELPVAALAGPSGPLHTFPNGTPYRVLINPFTPSQEVVEVRGTATGPDRLLLNRPVIGTHLIGVRVVLMADLLRISPALGDDHLGKISDTDRFGFYAKETRLAGADLVRPVYDSVTLNLAGTDFPVENGRAVFNFGNRLIPVKSSLVSITGTTIELTDTSNFPTTGYPYTIYLDVGAGPLLEEVLHVTNNNTGTDELTVSHAPVFLHSAGKPVEFRPGPQENFSYTTRTAGVLSFTNGLQIQHTHQEAEYLAPTVGTNYPRSNGFDFPLRIPITLEDRIRYVVDLVRAAGVEVTFISQR